MILEEKKTDPFIIGITGAIGTGKSLVRKMLEHKGFFSIDADHLAHEAYAIGSKGYLSLIKIFGNGILAKNGQISRKKLGVLVFHNPQALEQLEQIIHPLVSRAVNQIALLSPLPMITIEAIKLMESDIRKSCDAIWIITSSTEEIYQRLNETRGMNRTQVEDRLAHQPVFQIDSSIIDATIVNQGNLQDLWNEVSLKLNALYFESPKFRKAMDRSQSLLESFQGNLIPPESVYNLEPIFDNQELSVISVSNLSQDQSHVSLQKLETANLDKYRFQYFFWKYFGDMDEESCLVSDIENFTTSVLYQGNSINTKNFKTILKLIEDFSSLHLCHTLFLSFNKLLGSDLNLPGYKNCNQKVFSGYEPTALGYNLLRKQLGPSMDYFGEYNL